MNESQESSLKLELMRLLEEKERRRVRRKILQYYPEEGTLSRFNYPKHMEFFKAGKTYRERLMLAANRIGKTEGVGGYEVTLHMTGVYPEWWEGRKFDKPVDVVVAGSTNFTVRDILQFKLLGPKHNIGTGMVPGDLVVKTSTKQGIPDAIENFWVKHVSGGVSVATFKSYEQGRKSFEGTERDVIWMDEEPPLDIYAECLMRTMTTKGIVLMTFTPLLGISDVVMEFMPGGKIDAYEGYQA